MTRKTEAVVIGNLPVHLSIVPGRPGTEREVRLYGEQLVKVRYRYDKGRRMRYKTVELTIDSKRLKRR